MRHLLREKLKRSQSSVLETDCQNTRKRRHAPFSADANEASIRNK